MPAFILLSGYFTRLPLNEQRLKGLPDRVLVPHFFSQIIFATLFNWLIRWPILIHTVTDKNFFFPWFTSLSASWYLLALFFWRIELMFYSVLKPHIQLLVAMVMGLFVGYTDLVGVSHTVVSFFPFFLVSNWLPWQRKDENWQLYSLVIKWKQNILNW